MELTRDNYPKAYDYLGIGTKPYDETQLSTDIETLTEILPRFVTMMDEDKSLVMPNIEIGYIVLRLIEVRDELRRKGGAR